MTVVGFDSNHRGKKCELYDQARQDYLRMNRHSFVSDAALHDLGGEWSLCVGGRRLHGRSWRPTRPENYIDCHDYEYAFACGSDCLRYQNLS